MIRYILLLAIYVPFYLLALLIAPALPLFAEMRAGPIANNNGCAVEPRLPLWLSWFDTSADNSLWGDGGWREKHCQKYWACYWGMVLWLWRNPACGFAWQVLARRIDPDDEFVWTHSGRGLDVDKGKGKYGWYFILARGGAFSLRWCKQITASKVLSFEAGWLLDIYIKDAAAKSKRPIAPFQFQPQIKSISPSV